MNSSLLVAAEWIDGIYGEQFAGIKTDGFTQDREWPRTGAVTNTDPPYLFTDTQIPDRVINAAYEAAWRHGNNPGCLEVDYTPGKYKSVSVDGALSVQYREIDGADIQIQIAAIDRLLWPLLDCKYGGGLSGLSGSLTR
jgi:hypothetical protein